MEQGKNLKQKPFGKKKTEDVKNPNDNIANIKAKQKWKANTTAPQSNKAVRVGEGVGGWRTEICRGVRRTVGWEESLKNLEETGFGSLYPRQPGKDTRTVKVGAK